MRLAAFTAPSLLLVQQPLLGAMLSKTFEIVQYRNVMDSAVVLESLQLTARVLRAKAAVERPSPLGALPDGAIPARGC